MLISVSPKTRVRLIGIDNLDQHIGTVTADPAKRGWQSRVTSGLILVLMALLSMELPKVSTV